jgi:hypothetical protein
VASSPRVLRAVARLLVFTFLLELFAPVTPSFASPAPHVTDSLASRANSSSAVEPQEIVTPASISATVSGSSQPEAYSEPAPLTNPTSATKQDPNEVYGRTPLAFIPNRGQTDASVEFQAQGVGGSLFFTRDRVVLSLPFLDREPEARFGAGDVLNKGDIGREQAGHRASRVRVDLRFEGTRGARAVQGLDQQTGTVNFLTDTKQAKWHTTLPTYHGLLYDELYPGIDLQFEGQGSSLKGTYYVARGTDPAVIRWSYGGFCITPRKP